MTYKSLTASEVEVTRKQHLTNAKKKYQAMSDIELEQRYKKIIQYLNNKSPSGRRIRGAKLAMDGTIFSQEQFDLALVKYELVESEIYARQASNEDQYFHWFVVLHSFWSSFVLLEEEDIL